MGTLWFVCRALWNELKLCWDLFAWIGTGSVEDWNSVICHNNLFCSQWIHLRNSFTPHQAHLSLCGIVLASITNVKLVSLCELDVEMQSKLKRRKLIWSWAKRMQWNKIKISLILRFVIRLAVWWRFNGWTKWQLLSTARHYWGW